VKKRIRVKVGDVIQIRLPNNKYAYGRIYNDAGIGIYKQVTDDPGKPPVGSDDFLFNVGIYKDVLVSGEHPVVGRDDFESEEAKWPPPHFIKDQISGEYRIYHRGIMRKASATECAGLEEAAVWDIHHIIDRIMKETSQSPN
jgi:Immunity protein 26